MALPKIGSRIRLRLLVGRISPEQIIEPEEPDAPKDVEL
jgi:hypothetical protein